jgi:ribosomal protein L35AE/L33A
MRNLPIQSLQFDVIKQNFKDFLKGNERYKDYNFEASGIGTIVNLMSYQTHYLGFFVKMLLDESFVDSAHTRQAQLSHAKKTGYVPKGRRASKAEVRLKVFTDTSSEPATKTFQLERGQTFSATNSTQDSRVFTVVDGSLITSRTLVGSAVTYTSDPIVVLEGVIRTWNFVVDSSIINQRFIIKDPSIDIDTIRVRVRENSTSTSFSEYILAKNISDLDANSKVYFVTTDEFGNYQVFFGNDVFGVQPQTGNAIEVTYVSTNGESGDGAKSFTFNTPITGSLAGFVNTEVVTLATASGGAEPQTADELRFAIPNSYRRQDRLITPDDYRTILLDEYRNIDSLNVWGGEDNVPRDYGKTYLSIKPRNSNRLTALAREEIRQTIVKKFGAIGADVVFVDPDFIDVNLTILCKFDLRKTARTVPELVNVVQAAIDAYNSDTLSKFNTFLSDVELLSDIRSQDPAFVSMYSRKVLGKTITQIHGSTSAQTVRFGNALVPSTVASADIVYSTFVANIKDNGQGLLNLVNKANGQALVAAGKVDYETGAVTYNLPQFAKVAGYETGTTGQLVFNGVPVNPDVNTYLNNIVRIASSKVTVL